MLFTLTHRKVHRFCAESCARQQSGEISVANMLEAYDYALSMAEISAETIKRLGALVEPSLNAEGWRRIPAVISSGDSTISWAEVPDAMERLLSHVGAEPIEWIRSLLMIHPFADGNGRVADILYNLMSQTMDEPILVPDLFGQARDR